MCGKSILVTLCGAGIVLAQSEPTVQLPGGTILGTICHNSAAKLFQGIPFAQPPIGSLRFMPPQPLSSSYREGVLNATKPPAPCIQWSSQFAVDDPTPSEDCWLFPSKDQPWGNGTCNATSDEVTLSYTLTSAWTAMAARGDPSTSLQRWPRFNDCRTEGIYIQNSTQVATLDYSECEFWDRLWASFGGVGFPNATAERSCNKAPANVSSSSQMSGGSRSRLQAVIWLSLVLTAGLLTLV